ncbi:unnamed protein product [Acanthoscelides obtectus]|uniref:Uncharacterized protein n=1 Tax=Acanthoscelides obtectus TaxID=200917 RepID=A0A9P0M7U4_ACAOB|nr:unnamed protein product [Acanthoscelides obtectus]CAK1688279.1 hypothetical protein AOBTE_LOCUS36667 [Acanthoscelides obtectus]
MQKAIANKCGEPLKISITNMYTLIRYMSLEINGCDTADNKLNNYFIKSVTDIVSTIPSRNKEAITAAVPLEEDFWRFQEISLKNLRKTVFQLKKKSTGVEAHTCIFVKQLFDVIGYPLFNIVNTSLRTGKMPSLKRSIIVPVPKQTIHLSQKTCDPSIVFQSSRKL